MADRGLPTANLHQQHGQDRLDRFRLRRRQHHLVWPPPPPALRSLKKDLTDLEISSYCSDPRFGFGLNDCSLEACGAAVQSQVLSYGLAYCSSEFPPPHFACLVLCDER